jgi:hypothetical protein
MNIEVIERRGDVIMRVRTIETAGRVARNRRSNPRRDAAHPRAIVNGSTSWFFDHVERHFDRIAAAERCGYRDHSLRRGHRHGFMPRRIGRESIRFMPPVA